MFTSHFLDINNIKLKSVKNYLEYNGWQHDNEFPNKKLLVYRKKYDNELLKLTIPASDKFSDYSKRLINLVELLSEIENVSESQILNGIIDLDSIIEMKERKLAIPKGSKDRLSFRIISKESENGSLPLAYTESILSGIKKLILSAIYTEKYSATPVLESNYKNLYSELSQYRMAQTDVGSFIINIDISLDDAKFMQLGFDTDNDDSYATTNSRKIIRRIQNGIDDICKSQHSSSDLQEIISNSYKKGLNANMCDAILEFKNSIDDVIVESKVEWAKELPEPKNVNKLVTIKNEDFIIFETISRKYKEQEIKNIEVTGMIVEMYNSFTDKNLTLSKRPTRYIVIAGLINNSLKKVKVYINEDDYRIACKAHSNQNIISLTGIVKTNSKQLVIKDYSNFTIIN
ncbi:hypothetical protein [uncultured Clostridium sp.]|uniref:hypothetical protein n=1 Tax=uncultured Clostridium sp. TaxID=59620 RepID=UPI0025CFF368|nr:hypothetical protein [uncultured Clostridium sp.]